MPRGLGVSLHFLHPAQLCFAVLTDKGQSHLAARLPKESTTDRSATQPIHSITLQCCVCKIVEVVRIRRRAFQVFRDAKDDVRQACRLHHDHGGGSAEIVNSTSKLMERVKCDRSNAIITQ